jgi:pyrimidine-nucleoside phosphorylase
VRAFVREKRDGRAHARESVLAFVAAFARGEVGDEVAGAWLMAAFLNRLDAAETGALTEALLHSGRVFDWRDLGRPSADKHSTGGVGDKISLVLAPLAAACGMIVPMVSGRGLGHTGGTLDKLESIPGFRTHLTPEALRAQLDSIGVAMVGQGPDLAPADGRLYALRDVTQTVERDYFIVPSIVSKKIAEGARAVVYDVKCGSGAFMKTREDARALATRLVETTRALGAGSTAFVTDMNWPIGHAVGNAVEVMEAWRVLHGEKIPGTRELSLTLAAEMAHLSGACPTLDQAKLRVREALDEFAALEKFKQMVRAQGGDVGALEQREPLERAPVTAGVIAPRDGVLSACDCFALGELVVAMGGGRRRKDDPVDARVGIRLTRSRGDRVKRGDRIAELLLAKPDDAAVRVATACFTIEDQAPPLPPADLVLERVG